MFHPLVAGPLLLGLSVLWWSARAGHVAVALGAGLGVLLVLLAAAWTQRAVLVTDRRVVEYCVLAAWLARRWPRFAGLETRRRRVVPLGSIGAARRDRSVAVLSIGGAEHRIACHDEHLAAQLVASIERELLRTPRLRPVRRIEEPVIKVAATSAAAAGPARCPYCHDDVPQEEAAACAGCGAGHHAECLEIHGGCAAFGCGAPTRARARA